MQGSLIGVIKGDAREFTMAHVAIGIYPKYIP